MHGRNNTPERIVEDILKKFIKIQKNPSQHSIPIIKNNPPPKPTLTPILKKIEKCEPEPKLNLTTIQNFPPPENLPQEIKMPHHDEQDTKSMVNYEPETEYDIKLDQIIKKNNIFKPDDFLNFVKLNERTGLKLDFQAIFNVTQRERKYTHATYVNGFDQLNAYICTQTPLDKSAEKFWNMIWEQKVFTVALTTKGVAKKDYMPLEQGGEILVGQLSIKNNMIIFTGDNKKCKLTYVTVQHCIFKTTHKLIFCEILSDSFNSEFSSSELLNFIKIVNKNQEKMLELFNYERNKRYDSMLGPAQTIECASICVCYDPGSTNDTTGLYCALDICIKYLQNTGTINVKDIVRLVRLQRSGCLNRIEEYLIINKGILRYAKKENLLNLNS